MSTMFRLLVCGLVLHTILSVLVVRRLPLFDADAPRQWIAIVCTIVALGYLATSFTLCIEEAWIAPEETRRFTWLRCDFVVRAVTRFDPQLVVYELLDTKSHATSFWPRARADAYNVMSVGTAFTAYQNPSSPTDIVTDITVSPLVTGAYMLGYTMLMISLFLFGCSLLMQPASTALRGLRGLRGFRRRVAPLLLLLPPPYADTTPPPPPYGALATAPAATSSASGPDAPSAVVTVAST